MAAKKTRTRKKKAVAEKKTEKTETADDQAVITAVVDDGADEAEAPQQSRI